MFSRYSVYIENVENFIFAIPCFLIDLYESIRTYKSTSKVKLLRAINTGIYMLVFYMPSKFVLVIGITLLGIFGFLVRLILTPFIFVSAAIFDWWEEV